MKSIILCILLQVSLSGFSQAPKTTTIQLSTDNCRGVEGRSWNWTDTVTLYRLPADTLAYTIIPGQFIKYPVEIKNAGIGHYRVCYKNHYGQTVTQIVTLTQKATNVVTLCPDKLLAYPQNTLTKMQEKDSMSISVRSQGCFHTNEWKITITKLDGRFIARLYNLPAGATKMRKKTAGVVADGAVLQTVTLTQLQIQAFVRFENELNYAKDGGCTTTDTYDIKSKYLNVNKTDGSCNWNGAYFLRRSIFGEKG